MLELVLLILMSYKGSYQPVYEQPSEQEMTGKVEFGDCQQLPSQKTLGSQE